MSHSDPAEHGRFMAQSFIASITGKSGHPAFWPTLDSEITRVESGAKDYWHGFYLGQLSHARAARDQGIAARDRREYERLAELNRIVAEVPLLEAAIARAGDDEFGTAYRKVLTEYADGLKARLERIAGR